MTTALVPTDAPAAVAVVQPPRANRLLMPIAAPADIIGAQNATRDLVAQALQDGRDFGKIPGTDKPTLLKPGAERVALAFGCYYGEPRVIEREIDHDREVRWVKRKKQWKNRFKGDREFDWVEESGVSLGLYRYVLEVPVIERASGQVVGTGIGACSTLEAKYIDRPRDCENTVLKMAHKRAVVSAALVTFGLSDQFTQDVEDLPHVAGDAAGAASAAAEPEPPITRDSQVTWGKAKGTAIKDLDDGYLKWAIEPGRKFGADTEKWQVAMRQELDAREQAKADATADQATLPLDGKPKDATLAPAAAPAGAEFPGALNDEDNDLPF